MAKRVAISTLNASTIDILNVIRQNASYDYQQNVPVVTKSSDIPKVGEVIYGTPAFANQFINALVNRIAAVRMQSVTFNNPYKALKKGYIEFGESIEDIFIGLANVVDYSADKGASREFKRTYPDVRSAFYTMNWRVMYPITIQDEDLRLAFTSADGVTSLIAKIVDSVYTSAEYDEFLLFKYLLIKGISHGKVKPIATDSSNFTDNAVKFRGTSNLFPFIRRDFNEAGVRNNTPKERQVIFMDSTFNAQFDVNVLASAFNMDKADFMGKLYLIDDWTSFDNERFSVIRENSDGIEEVTSSELALLADVKAVLLDENWFQIFDNNNKFTEQYVASGLYWNYFYHTWKTVSNNPFANAVVFVGDTATISAPSTITVEVTNKSISEEATVLTLTPSFESASLSPTSVNFVQTNDMTDESIAMHKYGAVIIPSSASSEDITVVATIGNVTYTAGEGQEISSASVVGDTITLTKNQ